MASEFRQLREAPYFLIKILYLLMTNPVAEWLSGCNPDPGR
jgi:hypothetical protein